jgi:hypothetical protein
VPSDEERRHQELLAAINSTTADPAQHEVPPGSRVRCERREVSDCPALVAVALT